MNTNGNNPNVNVISNTVAINNIEIASRYFASANASRKYAEDITSGKIVPVDRTLAEITDFK